MLGWTEDLCACVQSDQAETAQALHLEEAPQAAVDEAALTSETQDPWWWAIRLAYPPSKSMSAHLNSCTYLTGYWPVMQKKYCHCKMSDAYLKGPIYCPYVSSLKWEMTNETSLICHYFAYTCLWLICWSSLILLYSGFLCDGHFFHTVQRMWLKARSRVPSLSAPLTQSSSS